MQIVIVEIPAPSHDERRTLIQIVGEALIEVEGFGSGEGRWRMHQYNAPHDTVPPGHVDLRDALGEADAEGWRPIMTLGAAFVWMEPRTWAYALMDVWRNQ